MPKDRAAQALARKRWSKTGPEARSQAGRHAAQARWKDHAARSRASARTRARKPKISEIETAPA